MSIASDGMGRGRRSRRRGRRSGELEEKTNDRRSVAHTRCVFHHSINLIYTPTFFDHNCTTANSYSYDVASYEEDANDLITLHVTI